MCAVWSCHCGDGGRVTLVRVMQKGSHRGTITPSYDLLDTKLYNTFIE